MALALSATTSIAMPLRDDPPAPRAVTADQPVITELHTVIRERDAGRTLSIVLAGAALLVAGAGAGYSVVRMSRLEGI
jgi:hypothetical protein